MKSYQSSHSGWREVATTWYEAMIEDFRNTKYPLRDKLRKWLLCSWVHPTKRCYPGVDIPFENEEWHCRECDPCWLGMYEMGLIGEDERVSEFLKKFPHKRRKS